MQGNTPTVHEEPSNSSTEVDEYSWAFNLHARLDEERGNAVRLRSAAEHTTGLEREANVRQAAAAEADASRIEAELAAGYRPRGGNAPTDTAEAPEVHQSEAADAGDELTPTKRAAIIERLGRRYRNLESALNRGEEWTRACRIPNRKGWYYFQLIEAACRARYGGAEIAPTVSLSSAEQLRRISR